MIMCYGKKAEKNPLKSAWDKDSEENDLILQLGVKTSRGNNHCRKTACSIQPFRQTVCDRYWTIACFALHVCIIAYVMHWKSIINGMIRLLLVLVVRRNVSILHRFRDITNFTVNVTACDLEKFCFKTIVEITDNVFFVWMIWVINKIRMGLISVSNR